MTEPRDVTFRYYVSDLGKLIRDDALEAKKARDIAAADGTKREYEAGRLMAYYAVISTMQQQAIAFGLSFNDVGFSWP